MDVATRNEFGSSGVIIIYGAGFSEASEVLLSPRPSLSLSLPRDGNKTEPAQKRTSTLR